MKCQRWRFLDDPVRRPASRIAVRSSSARGSDRKRRTTRSFLTARSTSIDRSLDSAPNMAKKAELIEVAGRTVTISNPDKLFFRAAGYTKRDLVNYYLVVAEGALRGAGGRPMALKRFVDGADGEFFFQKRAPDSRPDWIETVELSFPSGRTADAT